MTGRHGRSLVLAALMALGACAPGPEAAAPTVPSPTTPIGPSPSPAIQDIMELDPFAPLEPGTYFIDPDLDPSTPLRIVYEIPTEGWQQWIGAVRFAEDGHVGLSITTVSNLVTDGCRDHSWADPPVGPSVADLAAALADLAPFRMTAPPKDVTIYGYNGMHLEWTVPDLPVEGEGDDRRFATSEEGTLKSWVDHRHGAGGRVLRLQQRAGPYRGVLDPRHRGHAPDDRGELVAEFAAEACRRDARHPGLDPDRAMRPLMIRPPRRRFG